jgi:TRAP-type mannitol/chloroaromatic compound transport system permease small subunit
MDSVLRVLAGLMVTMLFLFLVDNTLIFWFEWPGLARFAVHLNLIGEQRLSDSLTSPDIVRGWVQLLGFFSVICAVVVGVLCSTSRKLCQEAEIYTGLSSFIVRAAFWAVFLVGVTDMVISLLRVEGFLGILVGDHITTQLGRPIFRGTYVHFPLIVLSLVIAYLTRTLGFIWLALLIVVIEFIIVLSRFVFSYEQAFMGDLVRFWYAGLFLFSSAYTLLHDGHVRVDVLYTKFTSRGKALTNALGSALLGLPICWNILIQGMSGRGSIINSPLLSFEISQSGFGMYTKYLMAAFLVVFSVTMAIQFVSLILSSVSELRGELNSNNNRLVEGI